MKIRLITLFAGLMALAMLPGSMWGQSWWGAGFGTAPNPLGLTPQQQNQIQEIVVKWQTDLTPTWTALQAKGMELRTLMWNPNPDPSAVEAKTKEYGDLQAELQRKSLQVRDSIRGVLTDEQRTIYDQMGLGYGWGVGPGAGWGGGFGRGRGFGRGGGWSRGSLYGTGMGYGPVGSGFFGPRWGRGPCGMGLGRTGGFAPWTGPWPW